MCPILYASFYGLIVCVYFCDDVYVLERKMLECCLLQAVARIECRQGTVWQMAELCRLDRLFSAFVAAKFYGPCCKTTHRQRIFYNVFHPNKSQKTILQRKISFFLHYGSHRQFKHSTIRFEVRARVENRAI